MFRLVIAALVVGLAGVAAGQGPAVTVAVDELVEGISCAADPSQTYTLYLPSAYTSERQWPVLLVFDPRGRSVLAAELFVDAAREYGWVIVSSNDTRSDGAWDPNIKAVNALWTEVHGRISGDPSRMYAAGFSGTATVARSLAKQSGELAGVIACGGPLAPEQIEGMNAPVFGTAGNLDYNFQELHRLDEVLAERETPRRMVIFNGAHSWMPPEVARQAVEWLELLAMQKELKAPDAALVNTLYLRDMAVAEGFLAEGQEYRAARWLRSVTRVFDGLHDIQSALAGAEELEASPAYARQQKESKRWRAFESRSVERLAVQLDVLKNADIPPPSQLIAKDLRIEELLKRAQAGDAEGQSAQRVLNLYYSQFSFYVVRDFFATDQYDRAAVALELAVRIRDDNSTVWYNLACSRARLDRLKSAVQALQRSVEVGFDNDELLRTDKDLDPLRDREDFRAILAGRKAS